MNRVLVLLLVAAFTTAGAEVFRHVAPDGTVTFSDTPSPEAERVEVRPAQAVSVPPVSGRAPPIPRPGGNAEVGGKPAPAYTHFAIVEPANGASVRANDGSVTVSLSLQPPLAPGHTIELLVDGEDGGKLHSGTGLVFRLSDLSRGAHTVVARVRNAKGDLVGDTGTVSFHVLRVAVGG